VQGAAQSAPFIFKVVGPAPQNANDHERGARTSGVTLHRGRPVTEPYGIDITLSAYVGSLRPSASSRRKYFRLGGSNLPRALTKREFASW
jgi:hypothetical protein